jgi:uncharacterized protein (TIGR03437 family)
MYVTVGSVGSTFTATAISQGNWLNITPSTGVVPAAISVSVNPGMLTAGSYTGTITITAGNQTTSQTAPVTLVITGTTPSITSVVNGASLLPGPLAPGEIITIVGRDLGPVIGANAHLTSSRAIETLLSGTRVLIDGRPVSVLYTQASQVNAIVTQGIAGRVTVSIQVEYQGSRSTAVDYLVADAAPGIFVIAPLGLGQAAIVNQDTSVNSDLNPADRGSIAVLYATGPGLMYPITEDGSITGSVVSHPIAPVVVNVDGQEGRVTYAGSAPGLVTGVLQVNFEVPRSARTGPAVGVLLKIGRFTSQPGVTMGVR